MTFELIKFELPPIGTHCYAVINPDLGKVSVFDAPLNAFPTIEKLCVERGLEMEGLYLTHGHWDHTLDAHRFAGAALPIFGHKGDEHLLTDPDCMSTYAMPGLQMRPVKVTRWLDDGQKMMIAGLSVEVRHVPGHSEGSILFWFRDCGFAISGDAIFKGSVGRTDFPGCSFAQLERSIIGQIYTLPSSTRLCPGHGPETTVSLEKSSNPFVRAQ